MVSVLLDWAMNSMRASSTDDTTATRCPKDGASSACKSEHSSCKEVNNPFHRGYTCWCLPGYHGTLTSPTNAKVRIDPVLICSDLSLACSHLHFLWFAGLDIDECRPYVSYVNP